MIRAALLFTALLFPLSALAQDARQPPREPSVRELQRAAARYAEVHPERVRSWQRRIRVAALAPSLTLRVGRGTSDLRVATAIDGTERFTLDSGDAWRLD